MPQYFENLIGITKERYELIGEEFFIAEKSMMNKYLISENQTNI